MCGIIGIHGKDVAPSVFEQARDLLTPRGPDDAGIFHDASVQLFLGHRRLSILDLSSAGQQPMGTPDGRYVIVFNGEIYNYLELREELRQNYTFTTETDTEVLLAAFAAWGKGCLSKLNGMFAFAMWDAKERKLFCARDRMGEKPFFWIQRDGVFAFASEIKALLALGFSPRPNEHIIFEYLTAGLYDHSDETFFEGIRSLPAGHLLSCDGRRLSIERYWNLADAEGDHVRLTDAERRERLAYLLEDAVRLRFRSDVPVGINLSSGLDSNVLYYYSNLVSGAYPPAFSLYVESEKYNERSVIETFLSPDQKKSWKTTPLLPEEVLPLAVGLTALQDQPYGGIPTIGYAKLIQATERAGVIVLMEGQGLDEILAGYKYYELELEKDRSGIGTRSSIHYSQDMTTLVHANIFDTAFVKRAKRVRVFDAPLDSHLRNAQYRDLLYTKLPRVLRFNDHVTMAYSRELRLPYLDHRIVEFCFWLPWQYKIGPSGGKALVRNVVQKTLPKVVQGTQKKAFGAVQTEWFRKYFEKDIRSILSSASFQARGFWDTEALQKCVDRFFAGEGDNSFFLWQCINLELWFQAHID